MPDRLHDAIVPKGSCGVGFVARLDGVPAPAIVRDALSALVNLEHRGATGGDDGTGDGAGIMVGLPHDFFVRSAGLPLPGPGDYAVGILFLPGIPGASADGRTRRLVERLVLGEGIALLGWREVPVAPGVLGDLARQSLPRVLQVFLGRGEIPRASFERKLYALRRLIEKESATSPAGEGERPYFASLSSRTVVYKGLLTASQLGAFYPDLADAAFASSWAVVHQRYSTNTLPDWRLAQPFRFLAHNGEINTLRGNVNRMKAREPALASALLGDDLAKVLPVIDESGSDSAILDNVLELLVRSGRELPQAVMTLVPEAWGSRFHIGEDKRAFYEYASALMEPWDGPAALVFCDGAYLGATLDRNGLRPARYAVTRDGLVVLASEAGVLSLSSERVLQRGRLQPGKMLLVDLEAKRIVPDHEIKARISRRKPYRRWVKDGRIELASLPASRPVPAPAGHSLPALLAAFGYTDEDLRLVLAPMAERGQEPVGSMGNDSVLPVFSRRPQLLFSYFQQLFAQVTNPPIDPLREELVMSLMGWLGRERNLLEETPAHARRLKLPHPVLSPEELERIRASDSPDLLPAGIEITFPAGGDGRDLETALKYVCDLASSRIGEGASVIVLSDRAVSPARAPLPALLAVSALHHHLIRKGLRAACGIVVETAEAREVAHLALLVGYGASAVCPYLALAAVRDLAGRGFLEGDPRPEDAAANYVTALKKGLLKTLSRMGISTIRSYQGAQIFAAVGLDRSLVGKYFTGTVSRVGGIGLSEIAREANERHRRGLPPEGSPPLLLDPGSDYRLRAGGERHLWSPEAIALLQRAVRNGDYESYRAFAAEVDRTGREAGNLRGLLSFVPGEPVPLEEVEPEEAILKRLVSPAMSFGSIGREAHEAIGRAMNRLGGRSNSGEGGEDPERSAPARSKVRQVASGRFGVTASYLAAAEEIQIKIAQGAKPGEGGQLPGHKVSAEIARVRHTMPGVTLISPPPHHDIYSIEDLSELIYDLKALSPRAAVSVKLVSEPGVGTVAAGVAKGRADLVVISGQDGGTGASPLTAIKRVGLPWELGLAETQRALLAGGLRGRIRVGVDGGMKTARDVLVAALLGADEFGFGTAVLVSLGCVLARKCHLNSCPAGIATQDPELRKHFVGKPVHVENFFRFLARAVREGMAEMGFRSLAEMVGRSDRLRFVPAAGVFKAETLDLSDLVGAGRGDPGDRPPSQSCGGDPSDRPAVSADPECRMRPSGGPPSELLDDAILAQVAPALAGGKPVSLDLPIRNIHRAVGARLSGWIVRRFGPSGLPAGTLDLRFSGTAGQSFGAFLVPGVSLRLEGEANDYLGKGMSGGRIVVLPPPGTAFVPRENVIAGNTILYGATGGEVFLYGTAGERFAVRNSGAVAVAEGVGDHACEYMTGGTVVVLGPTGHNFAAGMSGGIAYVYDETELFDTRCNLDMVNLEGVWSEEDRRLLRSLIESHLRCTGSARAKWLIDNWESRLPLFVKVLPIDYGKALERMRLREDLVGETVSATEEVYK